MISGGGSAGHINPGIAIADKLKVMDGECEILFVGSKNGMENKLVPLSGYPIWSLDVKGIKRSLSLSNLKTLFKALVAEREARKMLVKFAPDAVIGTGGYVCYPVIKAASKMGIYTALHESNAVPGLAIKMLKKRVDRIFVSFDGCKKELGVGEKCIFSGNPLKGGFCTMTKENARAHLGLSGYKYVIVSFGGSLGARTVNDIALDIMESITSKRSDVLHLHACGKSENERFFAEFKKRGLDKCKNIRASEFIYDMPLCLMAADIAVCRSGSMTLSELAAAGVPSVLVPSPNVTGGHQYKNASAFSEAGAAFVVDERKTGVSESALAFISELLGKKSIREKMAKSVSSLSCPNAADIIASEIISKANKAKKS